MFVKFQHVDSNFFPILGSKYTFSTSIPLHTKKAELPPIKRNSNKTIIQTPNPVIKKYFKVNTITNPSLNNKATVVHKPTPAPHGFVKNRDEEQTKNKKSNSRNERTKNGAERSGVVGLNGLNKKVHTKCSTKWGRYGGCIPAILEALERVEDLDEAFKPWEESLSNKERTIVLKEQLRWERALEIFEWFKMKGCYEVNVIHYNIMLRVLGKAHQWSEVEKLLDEMGRRSIKPINSTYGTLIDVYSKAELREKSLYWLNLMNEHGVEPDEVTMGIVVQMYKKAGDFSSAEQYFKKWSLCNKQLSMKDKGAHNIVNGDSQAHNRLSSYTYNTLIDTYGKGGKLKDAYKTFKLMLRGKYMPNTVTFNIMIHTFGNNGRLDDVASLMQKMEQLGCLPDTRTYNILISLYAKYNNIELAASYFKKMKDASLEPDPVSYRTLLYAFSIRNMVVEVEQLIADMDKRGIEVDEFTQSALTRMYIEAGLVEKSFLWFQRFHCQGKMSSECYAANIDAFGERGYIFEAEKVFDCCCSEKPTIVEFNVMIKAYGISKMYDEACKLFDSIENNYGLVPDKCSYNSLVQMLANGGLCFKALTYARKMQDAGVMIDCIPYCAVLSSFVKFSELEMAVRVFKEMVERNIEPDVVVYGILINAFADTGDVKEAVRLAKAMKDAGIPMNSVICNSLIKLYTKLGYLKEAQEAYEMLLKLNTEPDLYSSNCMINLYSRQSMVEQAEEIFKKLKREGDANEFSYAMMLCLYKRIGSFDKANKIAQRMRELGLMKDLLSYNNVLGLYASEGRFKEAMGCFKEMMRCSIQPDDSTIRSLGVVLVKCGVPKQAVSKLEVTWKKDGSSGLKAWISTLDSVVGVFGSDA